MLIQRESWDYFFPPFLLHKVNKAVLHKGGNGMNEDGAFWKKEIRVKFFFASFYCFPN